MPMIPLHYQIGDVRYGQPGVQKLQVAAPCVPIGDGYRSRNDHQTLLHYTYLSLTACHPYSHRLSLMARRKIPTAVLWNYAGCCRGHGQFSETQSEQVRLGQRSADGVSAGSEVGQPRSRDGVSRRCELGGCGESEGGLVCTVPVCCRSVQPAW